MKNKTNNLDIVVGDVVELFSDNTWSGERFGVYFNVLAISGSKVSLQYQGSTTTTVENISAIQPKRSGRYGRRIDKQVAQ